MNTMEINSYYKIRLNVLSMLKERKYNIPKELFDMDKNLFKIKYEKEDLDISVSNDDGKKMYVKFNFKTLKTSSLKMIVKQIFELDENYNIIIISMDKIGHTILKILKLEEYKKIEIFNYMKFILNITKHELASKHILLNEEEILELLNKYNCEKKNLKKIKISDPMSRYYNAKLGDVFKIIRKSKASGLYEDYRVVIN